MTESNVSPYMAFIVAESLREKLEALDVKGFSLQLRTRLRRYEPEEIEDFEWWGVRHVEINVSYQVPSGQGRYSPDDSDREEFANQWLQWHPETKVLRSNGDIRMVGITSAGVSWEICVGRGLCEQVQVGTKVVTKIDPAYLENAPMIEVEEPVFETRCVDPLASAVAS